MKTEVKVYAYTDSLGQKVVKAIGSYRDEKITAFAVCHPDDIYDEEKGKAIAKAKVEAKIANRRANYAKCVYKCYEEASKAYTAELARIAKQAEKTKRCYADRLTDALMAAEKVKELSK